jgi:hypothetical protein
MFLVGGLPYGSFIYRQPDSSYYGLEIIICDAMSTLMNFR